MNTKIPDSKRLEAKSKAIAIKCLGGLLELSTSDPDPKAGEKYENEFNCKNCTTYNLCRKVLKVVLAS